jgi:hypothetical protein
VTHGSLCYSSRYKNEYEQRGCGEKRIIILSDSPHPHKPPKSDTSDKRPDIYTKFIAIGTVAGVVLSYLLLAQGAHWAPFDSAVKTGARSAATAVQIASAVESTVDGGQAVTNAHCDQGTVRAGTDGSTQVQCDLTVANGDIMRAAVTDSATGAVAQNQYQENISATQIANALIGLYGEISQSTVVHATCNPSTVSLQTDGVTDAECYLWMANGDQFYAAAQYNGISSPSFHSN